MPVVLPLDGYSGGWSELRHNGDVAGVVGGEQGRERFGCPNSEIDDIW